MPFALKCPAAEHEFARPSGPAPRPSEFGRIPAKPESPEKRRLRLNRANLSIVYDAGASAQPVDQLKSRRPKMQAPSTLSSVFQDTLHSRSQFQRKSAHTRARCAGVHLAAVSFLVLLACLPSSAQEARWKQLNAQAAQLQDQGRYGEALPIAQEAARVAEATFGTNNEITAASLNRLGNILSDLCLLYTSRCV